MQRSRVRVDQGMALVAADRGRKAFTQAIEMILPAGPDHNERRWVS